MKHLALSILLLVAPLAAREPSTAIQAPLSTLAAQKQAQAFLGQLEAFYAPQDKRPKADVLAEAVQGTVDAARLLCLEDQVATLLAMWHSESAYNPHATGDPWEDSAGVAQTRRKYINELGGFWEQRGVDLAPFSSVRTQAFMGVAEFAGKLRMAKGNVKEAVRRYNGSGKRARLYAHKVMVSRRVIFKMKHRQGETAKACQEG